MDNDSIVDTFLYNYGDFMSSKTDLLSTFFTLDSVMSIRNRDVVSVACGKEEISALLTEAFPGKSRDYCLVHVDSQLSLQQALLITVMGKIENSEFHQVFVLANGPLGYYIKNTVLSVYPRQTEIFLKGIGYSMEELSLRNWLQSHLKMQVVYLKLLSEKGIGFATVAGDPSSFYGQPFQVDGHNLVIDRKRRK